MSSLNRSRFLEWSYNAESPLKTLWKWADCHPTRAFWLLILYAFKAIPNWSIPLMIGFLIDAVRETPDTWTRYWPLVLLQFALLAQNIPLDLYYVTQLSGFTRRLENRLRRALVTRLQELSIPYHDDSESGELQAKILRDVEQVQILAHSMADQSIAFLVVFSSVLIITLTKQPLVLLVYFILIPVLTVITRTFRGKMRRENKAFRKNLESMNSEVSQMIEMIPVSRAHGIEDQAIHRVTEKIQNIGQTGQRLDRLTGLFNSTNWVTFHLFNFTTLLVMLGLASKDYISIGDVLVFQALFGQTFGLVNIVLNMFPQIAKGMESIRSIGEVLECPDLEHNKGKPDVKGVQGEIRFEDVEYTYGEEQPPSLQGIDLEIPPGQCLAVVGPSGGGKSTLLRLIIGFRRPTKGKIFLDGQDMETIDMRSWRRFISVVPQESVFFEGSVRDNILFGTSGVSNEQLDEILDAANVREFVEKLPHGLDTRIGESGARLSGGQRQRLAIARALVRNPQVIVLDEPTSALDVMSEKLVQEAIERLAKGRTTLIVAHLLSTIRNADRIVVMEKGRIVESGTYDALSNREDSAFRKMKDLQT